MKTFPITDENYNSKFSRFGQNAMLPDFEWGKKLYMEYEGKLRAVKPLYAAYVSNTKKTGSPIDDCAKSMVCFDIAGIGRKLLKWEVYYDDRHVRTSSWNKRIFRTTEDYDNFISGQKGTDFNPGGIFIADIFRVHGHTRLKESQCWDFEVIEWCWNYEEARECPVSFKDIWVDEDGANVTVIHEGWGDPKYKSYMTREGCLEANRKEVVDFDEEPAEAKKPELTEFEDRLAEIIYDAIGELDPDVMDECCDQARKYSSELIALAKNA